MHRRTVLVGICVGLSGCLGQNLGQATQPQTTTNQDSMTNPITPFETETENTHVTFEIIDRRQPAPDEPVSGEFDCKTSKVVLTGWLRPPNSCHHVLFESYEYTTETGTVTIVLGSQTDSNESTDGTTCEGINYKFHIVLKVDGEVPQTVEIEYRPSDNKYEDSFEVTNQSCH